MVKPFDVVIIFPLIVLSFLPTAIFAVQQTNNDNNNVYAVISINGEEVDHRFLLTGNEEHRLITYYPAPGKYNIV
jgi:hypothetical protein|nr:hypothetical protein [Lactococcus raffinolactis]